MEEENNNNEEMSEVEVLEFSLDEEEIDELVGKLQELKQTKQSVSFDIDEENELKINYAPEGVPSDESKDSEEAGE